MVGVSSDGPQTQCEFADAIAAPFPLIGDPDSDIIQLYGVGWPLVKLAQRVTFLIGKDRTVLRRFHHEVMATRHVDDVLAALEEL